MTSITDIANVIKMLGDVVKSTREIIKAMDDGSKYLKLKHPEAGKDIENLLDQMQQALVGLAEVTKVVSSFRFVSSGAVDLDNANRELARFNNYVMAQRTDILRLRGNIRKLKADCEKVRLLRDKLDAQTKSRSWGSMFQLFGKKAQLRSTELHSSLSNFYADDQRMIELLRQMLDLAENAIKDVEAAIGPPGVSNPYNVPLAAQILNSYAALFDTSQGELNNLADNLNDVRISLQS